MAEAATIEPTVDNDGFTAEERAQFEGMREAEAPAPETPTPDPASSPGAGADAPAAETSSPAAGAAPAAAATEDDDGEDEPAAAAPDAPADPNQRQPRRVAYGKFQRLEAKYKELQARTAADAETKARLDERLKLINEALATPAQPEGEQDPEPDPEKDIFGHNAWLKRQFTKQQQQLEELRSGRQAETEDSQVASTYLTDAEQLARQEPNFIPAYQHLMGVRLAQLAMYYYDKDVTDQENPDRLTAKEINHIRQIAAAEEKQVVAEALKNGQSPAQRIYQLARASGFRPQAAQPAAAANGAAKPTNGAAQPANGKAAPAAPNGAVAAQPTVADEIAKIKAGQDASLTLSGGGGVPNQPMTAERLANMPQQEFERWMEATPPEVIRQIMGG